MSLHATLGLCLSVWYVESGGVAFCILLEGPPRFTQTGEPATAVANDGSFIILLFCFYILGVQILHVQGEGRWVVFVTAGLPAGRALPVSVKCGVGGFCILQEGAPHFTQGGKPAMANGVFLFC